MERVFITKLDGQTHIDRLLMHRRVVLPRSTWAMGSLVWSTRSTRPTRGAARRSTRRASRSWPFSSFTVPRIDAIYSIT